MNVADSIPQMLEIPEIYVPPLFRSVLKEISDRMVHGGDFDFQDLSSHLAGSLSESSI